MFVCDGFTYNLHNQFLLILCVLRYIIYVVENTKKERASFLSSKDVLYIISLQYLHVLGIYWVMSDMM